MNYRNTIVRKIQKSLKTNNEKISPNYILQLSMLDSIITDYEKAKEDIETNGIKCFHNNGKTIGQNPAIKVKLECAKLILRILKGFRPEEIEEVDEFMRSLM